MDDPSKVSVLAEGNVKLGGVGSHPYVVLYVGAGVATRIYSSSRNGELDVLVLDDLLQLCLLACLTGSVCVSLGRSGHIMVLDTFTGFHLSSREDDLVLLESK